MGISEKWFDVITHPLGLAGFALFLVFFILSKKATTQERRWLIPVFTGLAFIALIGGLALSWSQRETHPLNSPKPPNRESPSKTSPTPLPTPAREAGKGDTTTGDQSPIITHSGTGDIEYKPSNK